MQLNYWAVWYWFTLRENCPYSEFFRYFSPYSVWVQENTNQNNSEYGYISSSVTWSRFTWCQTWIMEVEMVGMCRKLTANIVSKTVKTLLRRQVPKPFSVTENWCNFTYYIFRIRNKFFSYAMASNIVKSIYDHRMTFCTGIEQCSPLSTNRLQTCSKNISRVAVKFNIRWNLNFYFHF